MTTRTRLAGQLNDLAASARVVAQHCEAAAGLAFEAELVTLMGQLTHSAGELAARASLLADYLRKHPDNP